MTAPEDSAKLIAEAKAVASNLQRHIMAVTVANAAVPSSVALKSFSAHTVDLAQTAADIILRLVAEHAETKAELAEVDAAWTSEAEEQKAGVILTNTLDAYARALKRREMRSRLAKKGEGKDA